MKLAALWIAKNEAENIRRSIESLGGMADELLVVDTGSTDDTAAVAEGLGARVASFEWSGDFAAARNFALGQTDADIVLFLDADEWFEPALDKAGRKALEGLFADGGILVGMIRMRNIDADSGALIEEISSVRALRGGGALSYHGRIHEHVLPVAGGLLAGGTVPGLCLAHDGYSQAKQQEKLRRNFEMLKSAEAEAENAAARALYQMYLMREAGRLGEYETAFAALDWLLGHSEQLRRVLRDYIESGLNFMFEAIRLAARFRARVSREAVYAATVENAQKLYAGHPLHHTIGLYYNLYLDSRDDLLLAELDAAVEKAEQQRGEVLVNMDDYLQANIELFTAAGKAAWRRGNRELAFDYAARAVKLTKTMVRPETLALLIHCVRGLPSQDVAAFLSSMLDVSQRSVLESLLSCLHYEGEKELYAWVVKRLLDAGWAKKSEFWYLMILLGKAEEAVDAALQAEADTGDEVVRRTLFLAVACGGEQAPELLARCRERLGRYEALAAYMAAGQAVENPDFDIARANYELIAFAAGRETANRLLDAYSGVARECWLLQAGYYLNSALYRELLFECPYVPMPDDEGARLIRAERDLLAGDHERALTEIKILLANSAPDAGIFNLCAVVAEKALDADVREEAELIIEQVRPLYEQMVSWQDIANTDWLPVEDTKKQRKALGQMTVAQFDRSVAPRGIVPPKGVLEAATAAAEKLVAAGRYEAALPALCCRLDFGSGTNRIWELLGDLFDGAGNPALAKAMRGRVIGQ